MMIVYEVNERDLNGESGKCRFVSFSLSLRTWNDR